LRPQPRKLQLYGDWFNGDSRAIYAILKHADVDFDWTHINMFDQTTIDESFREISPNGYLPVIVAKDSVALLQGLELYDWVLKQEATLESAMTSTDQD